MTKLSKKLNISTKSIFYIAGFAIVNLYILYSIYYMIYGQARYPHLNTQLEFWSMMVWGILLEILMQSTESLFDFESFSISSGLVFSVMIALSIILLNVFAWYASKLAFKVYGAIRKK
jgi:phosphatidylserine synthase